MSGPISPPLTVTTVGGTPSGRPITTIKVSNGDLTISGSTATIDTSGGGGGTGTVTSIATTAPITGGTITTTGTIGISQADGSTNGFLSSTDWNTFDAKQDTITLTTTGTSGAASLVGATLNIPNYTNSSTIGGTIANTQVAYGSATDAIQGSANMTFDGSNLSVSGYIKGGNVTIGNGTGEIETDDANDLVLKTNGGTNSGTLTLKNGAGGNAIFQPDTTGVFQFNGVSGGNDGAIMLMCSEGTHSQTISAAPHATAATYSLVLPTGLPADADNKYLVSDTSGNMSFTTGGSGSVTFPLQGSDGSAAAPTYSFSNDTDTGIYGTVGNIYFSTNGVGYFKMGNDGAVAQLTLGGGTGTGQLTTNGPQDLILNTNLGTNSGVITINNGADSNITINPNGTGTVGLGNFVFDVDQTAGAGQDNYVLTYDNSVGSISLEAAGGGVTFPLEAPAGTAGAPSYSFASDEDTGFFRSGSDSIGVAVGATEVMTIGPNITSTIKIFGPDGGAGNPSFGFKDDVDTGIYRPATGQIALSMNGSNKLTFGASGEILIGGSVAGTSGQVLTSGGSGSAMSWADSSGGGISNSAGNLKIQKTATGGNISQYPLFTQWGDGTSSSNAIASFNTTTATLYPFFGHKTGDIQSITYNITSEVDDDWLIRVYDVDSNNLPQNAVGSQVTGDNGSTGDNTLDVSGITDTWNITAGDMYYIAIMMKSADNNRPTVRTYQDSDTGVQFNLPYCDVSTAQYNIFKTCFKLSGLSAALPSSVTTSNLTSDGAPFAQIPIIGVAY